MGMYTDFTGEIKLKDKAVISYIKIQLKLGFDDADYPIGNFYDADIKGDTLRIHSYERNYEEDIETALAMLIILDPNAEGEVLSTYSDGTIEHDPKIREKFVLKNSKVYKSVLKEVKLTYGKEDIYNVDFDEETIQERIESVKRCSSVRLCQKCSKKIEEKFDFKKRGYYDEIHDLSKYKDICQSCYNKLKEPFVKKRKLESELDSVNKEIHDANCVKGDVQ